MIFITQKTNKHQKNPKNLWAWTLSLQHSLGPFKNTYSHLQLHNLKVHFSHWCFYLSFTFSSSWLNSSVTSLTLSNKLWVLLKGFDWLSSVPRLQKDFSCPASCSSSDRTSWENTHRQKCWTEPPYDQSTDLLMKICRPCWPQWSACSRPRCGPVDRQDSEPSLGSGWRPGGLTPAARSSPAWAAALWAQLPSQPGWPVLQWSAESDLLNSPEGLKPWRRLRCEAVWKQSLVLRPHCPAGRVIPAEVSEQERWKKRGPFRVGWIFIITINLQNSGNLFSDVLYFVKKFSIFLLVIIPPGSE